MPCAATGPAPIGDGAPSVSATHIGSDNGDRLAKIPSVHRRGPHGRVSRGTLQAPDGGQCTALGAVYAVLRVTPDRKNEREAALTRSRALLLLPRASHHGGRGQDQSLRSDSTTKAAHLLWPENKSLRGRVTPTLDTFPSACPWGCPLSVPANEVCTWVNCEALSRTVLTVKETGLRTAPGARLRAGAPDHSRTESAALPLPPGPHLQRLQAGQHAVVYV